MRSNRAANQTWMALLAVLLTSTTVLAENWTTITSGWRPSRIVEADGRIWAVSEGGVLRVNPVTGSLDVLNVDDGLSANMATAIEVDPNTGHLWIGYDGAALDIYNPATGTFTQRIRDFFNDSDATIIHDVSFHDNRAYVATNQGLSLLTYSSEYGTWVVIDTYRAFGPWPRSTEIRQSVVFDGQIFAGGIEGVAVAPIGTSLIDAANWQVFDYVDDLGIASDVSTYTRMLKVVDGNLYLIAYTQGYFIWQDGQFVRFGSEWFAFGLAEWEGELYGATSAGLKRYNPGSGQFVLVDDPFRPKFFDLCTYNGSLWLAMDTNLQYFGGIANYDGSNFEAYYPNTPGGDQISQINTAPDGSIWVAAKNSVTAGFFHFKDGNWYPYSYANHPEGRYNRFIGVTSIEFDARGDAWFGTWGDGCSYVTRTSVGKDTVLLFDATNSTLRAVNSPPSDYVVVGGMALDPSGGLWLGNTSAYSGHSIVYIPPDWFATPLEFRTHDGWVQYGVQQGLNVPDASTIVVDSRGRLWIEALHPEARDRLTVLDPKGDPENTDDQTITTIALNQNMDDYGPVVDMALDRNGKLWLATPAGLFWVDTEREDLSQVSFNRLFGILGESVNALAIDPIGQVWVGTDFGLSVVGRDGFSIVRNYTTMQGSSPSPLIADKITSLSIDPRTGDVYIGTGEGLSVVSTPFRDFGEEIGEIEVVPQPFMIAEGRSASLEFGSKSLVAGASVRIYTPSGRLVRELNFETAAADGWDGRSNDGDLSASGVYLLVITDQNGKSKVGKVAVVRE